MQIMHECIPSGTIPSRRNRPWLTKKLIQAIRRRNSIYKQAKATNNFTKYRQYRNKVVGMLRNAKMAYFGKLNPRKSKEFWKTCKLLNRTSSSIPTLSNSATVAHTEIEKAELLNSFFASCFNQSHSPLDIADSHAIPRPGEPCSSILCDEGLVCDLLASLDMSKSTGPDGVSAQMLKRTAACIAPSVTLLFNQSLREGIIPSDWKTSHVVPIPKVSQAKSPDHYRPVSLLSILSKVLERHVYTLVADHLDAICPLSDCQWGFRAGRSTVSALLSTTTDWFSILETGNEICAIFFDYRKAFDSVPHRPLLNKLISLDLDPFILHWIADYLTARHQYVVVDGVKSSAVHVLSGVPQGSVLGPLLFLIYINDVNNLSLSPGACNVIFADDVCIYRSISCSTDYEYVQHDITAMEQWSADNFLTLNPSKCKYMLISRKRSPTLPNVPLLLHNLPLSKVSTFKYLGILLSDSLSWSPHIHAICSKARQILGLLYRKFYNFSNSDTLIQLYISLVRPHLEYASPVWSPHLTKDIQALERVQTFACKMVSHNWKANYQELLSLVDIPTLERRRLELKLGHLFKIIHNLCFFPQGVILPREQTPLICSTRSTHSLPLIQPFARTNSYLYSFVPHTVSYWNLLPQELVNAPSLSTFKSKLHTHNF